jgi:LytS/YehU family sensor histidine kinase
MLRYILDTEKSGTDHVMLDDELDFIRNYLDLEALRLGPRLNIEWDLDSKAGGISVPALSIQPLVENSITHAFNPRSQPGKLLIHCRLNAIQKRLEVVISDDGPGANLTDIAIATGMGIRTVERRLRLEYGAQADFKIITAPGEGFSVSFSIPLLSQ